MTGRKSPCLDRFDNFGATHRSLAIPPRKSPTQSGYCSTHDGREGLATKVWTGTEKVEHNGQTVHAPGTFVLEWYEAGKCK